MKKLSLVLLSMGLISCDLITAPPILISRVDTVYKTPVDGTNVVYPQPIIPTDTTKAWPIKVISVERNVDKSIDMKWQVVTENGIMYYTNKKPQIGDVAFCLGMNEEIVECDCEK
jgi:hypothetical protein